VKAKFKQHAHKAISGVLATCLGLGIIFMQSPLKAEAEDGMLLTNGTFEAVNADGTVPGWFADGASSGVELSESVKLEGARSLKVQDTDAAKVMGAQSEKLSVHAFDNVTLTAEVFSESGSGGKADLRFYDANAQLINVVSGLVDMPSNAWAPITVSASVPENAVTMNTAFYFPAGKTGVFYTDNASLMIRNTPDYIKNLGPQATSLTIMTAAYGKNAQGREVMFTVVQGDPAKFVVMDVLTDEPLQSIPLVSNDGTKAGAAWAIVVASDGKVYAGTTPNGSLYQYDPMTQQMLPLGKPIPTDTVIWTLVAGKNGKIYGGTGYSESLFEYDPATNVSRKLVSFKTQTKDYHVRSLAYDSDNEILYAGGSDIAKLYKYDLKTGVKSNISPAAFSGKTSVYDLTYTGGKLFVRIDPGTLMYVFDPAANQWVTSAVPFSSRGWSTVSPDNRVFYTAYDSEKQKWLLQEYDVNTNIYRSTGAEVKGPAISYHYLQLNEPNFPGTTLVGMAGNSGIAFKYNLQTGYTETRELAIPPEYVEIFNIGKALDGRIMTGAFISGGGMGFYTPTTDTSSKFPNVGQVESFGTLNGKTYLGVYPKASILVYDPKQPWNRNDPSKPNNPLKLGNLGDEQERPVTMVGVDELNKLYIGSSPIAGKTGGALSIYDPATNTFTVKRNIVPNHTINTMLYRNGKLYMGTGAQDGGTGKLVIYDIATDQIEITMEPAPGKKALTSFIDGPDGKIWGMAMGTLFIFDPDTHQIIYSSDKFPTADYTLYNPRLTVGTDGNVYATIFIGYVADATYTSKLIKIDASSPNKDVTILLESNAERITQDDFGNLYFKNGSLLYKYSDPNLVVGLTGAELSTTRTTLKSGDIQSTGLKGILAKGRTTNELTGAKKVYTSSHPEVASVNAEGVVSALKPGIAKISVQVTLNGSVVTSNEIEFLVQGPFTKVEATGAKGNADWYTSDVTLSFSADPVLSTPLVSTDLSFDGGVTWSTYGSSTVLSTEGRYDLRYRSTDAENRTEEPKQLAINIDKTAPVFTLSLNSKPYVNGMSVSDHLPVAFTLQTTDALSGVGSEQLLVDGKELMSGSSVNWAGQPGAHSVRVLVHDQAGNASDVTFVVTVTVSAEGLQTLLDSYVSTGEVTGSLQPQLGNSLKQAMQFAAKPDLDKAAKHMTDFLKHLDNLSHDDNVSATAKAVLKTDAEELIRQWTQK
jgi:hypothetical protein